MKITDYPLDYDNLDQHAVQVLLDWLNWCDETNTPTIQKKVYNVRSVMRQCGVYIEKDWVNHDGWFLATYWDARDQEQYENECSFVNAVNEFCKKEN